MQMLKPRAMYIRRATGIRYWVVRGMGAGGFGATLDHALENWRKEVLADQTFRYRAKPC